MNIRERMSLYNASLTQKPALRHAVQAVAYEQHPAALLITCVDSRISADALLQSGPGEVLVCRNVGNSVPVPDAAGLVAFGGDTASAIEFAVEAKGVRHLVICGHSDCGAVRLRAEGLRAPRHMPNVRRMLAAAASESCVPPLFCDEDLTELDRQSQHNVLQQVEIVQRYPCVQEAIAAGRLQIHAAWLDLRQGGTLLGYVVGQHVFVTCGAAGARGALLGAGVTSTNRTPPPDC